MLKVLRLRNFVLAKEIEIEFKAGLCVVSGETGAGKSLLVNALSLLTGARAGQQKIHPGAKQAEIEAIFAAAALPATVVAWLQDNALDEDDEDLLIRRVIREGKTTAFVNGRQIPLSQLAGVTAALFEICAQHTHITLKQPAQHRLLLDRFAGADGSDGAAAQVTANYAAWKQAQARWRECVENESRYAERRAWLQSVLTECDALGFSADKWRRMNETLNRALNSADLSAYCARVTTLLEDENRGAEKTLAELQRCLVEMQRKDAAAGEHIQTVEDALNLLRTVGHDVSAYAGKLETDADALTQAETFVAECHRLARKYNVSDAENLGAFIEEQQGELARLGESSSAAALQQAADAAYAQLQKSCAVLTEKRQSAAQALSKKVNAALKELGMAKSRFLVALTPLAEPTADGAEKVILQMQSRPGMPAASVGDIASGGELSRLSLALQLLSGHTAPVSVFDEVDTGIGGAAADVVGRMLRRLGRGKQVICITHLPQVAAHADFHWQVEGEPMAVGELTDAARVEELARMQSGQAITETARAHAQALLTSAQTS